MARHLIIILSALLTMLAAAPPASAQVPPGSYFQSCQDVRFDGVMLSAVCLSGAGQLVPTRLAVGDCRGEIANLNGQLACPGGEGRPYGGPPPQYGGGPPPPTPPYGYPPPRRDYGGPPRYGEGDYDGAVVGLPGGSWRASCGNPVMRGPILFADCQRGDGAIQQARADVRACRRLPTSMANSPANSRPGEGLLRAMLLRPRGAG